MLRQAHFVWLLLAAPAFGQILIEPPPPRAFEPRPLAWNETYTPLTFSERAKYHYVYKMVGPWGLFTTGYGAAIDQWQNDPTEWAGGAGAYSRRVAARAGTRIVRRSIRLGIEQFTHEDPRFFRSGERGFKNRAKNVLLQTVQVRKDDGGTTFPYGRVIGAFAAAQMSQAWYPGSRDGFGSNLQRGGMVLVGDLGTRMLREFWPEVRRAIAFKRKSRSTAANR